MVFFCKIYKHNLVAELKEEEENKTSFMDDNCKNTHIYITSHFVKNKLDEIHMHHSTSQTDRPMYKKKEERGFKTLDCLKKKK
jgi:hypothetical protein